jgi:hypothetical protein
MMGVTMREIGMIRILKGSELSRRNFNDSKNGTKN